MKEVYPLESNFWDTSVLEKWAMDDTAKNEASLLWNILW